MAARGAVQAPDPVEAADQIQGLDPVEPSMSNESQNGQPTASVDDAVRSMHEAAAEEHARITAELTAWFEAHTTAGFPSAPM